MQLPLVTITFNGHDIDIKDWLAGIDAPETFKKKWGPEQPYRDEAKKYLTGLVLNMVVDIKGYGFWAYNHILGVIFLGWRNVNLEMVKQGLATVYRGSQPCGFDVTPYREAETEARKAGRGIWSRGEKYVSPKKWRERKKKK